MRCRYLVAVVLLAAGCTPAPATFSKPAKDAPVWDINPDRMQSNDLVHEPMVGSR